MPNIPVENYKGILSYICEDFNRSIKLTQDNTNRFTDIFGKHQRKLHNGEFNFKVWVVIFEGNQFTLYTNKTKGTCIEIEGDYLELNDKSKLKIIKRFLQDLESRI
ncbi:MAG: hypothetical protein ACFFKA_00210 [Candidatus Thorarchaeota archaeon]